MLVKIDFTLLSIDKLKIKIAFIFLILCVLGSSFCFIELTEQKQNVKIIKCCRLTAINSLKRSLAWG